MLELLAAEALQENRDVRDQWEREAFLDNQDLRETRR